MDVCLNDYKCFTSYYSSLISFGYRNGYNGRACILRSLCEVTRLLPENDGFLEAIVKLLFRFVSTIYT